MITLAQDCLLFHLSNGETIPFSAEMISVELTGETVRWFEPEMVSQAAKAVFHFFKSELKRQRVTAEEFAEAMEKALRGVDSRAWGLAPVNQNDSVIESDLCRLARESGDGCELLFFPRLRNELREHLRRSPRVLRYHGLRDCVKQMARARRWSVRCRALEEQIVEFLRECAGAETQATGVAIVVE